MCLTSSKVLKLLVCANDALVVKSSYGHVPKANKLTTVSEFSNILGFCKALFKKSLPTIAYQQAQLISLITLFKGFYSVLLESDSWSASLPLICFIIQSTSDIRDSDIRDFRL